MTARTTPPFRADHVGSFLRPSYLLEAREQFFVKKTIDAAQLRAVEDKAITEIVKFQQDVGLQSITDGEFRRTYFHIDFLEQLGGVKTDIPVTVKKPDGTEELAPPAMRVIEVGHIVYSPALQHTRFGTEVVAADWDDLIANSPRFGVYIDEFGESHETDPFAWTNTKGDGDVYTTAELHHCLGWNSALPQHFAQFGVGYVSPTPVDMWKDWKMQKLWTNYKISECDKSKRLYCAEK